MRLQWCVMPMGTPKEGTIVFRPNYWGRIHVHSQDYEGDNFLMACGLCDGEEYRFTTLWSGRDCPPGSIPVGFFDLVLEQFNKARNRQKNRIRGK